MESTTTLDIKNAIERIRKKLLDLSRRNRLINFKARGNTIQIFDELPNQVFETIVQKNKAMKFEPLPQVNEEELDVGSKDTDIKALKKKVAAQKAKIELKEELPKNDLEIISKKHQDLKLQTSFFPEELEGKLHKIVLKARNILEETGVNQLYLSIGYLEWQESKDSNMSNLSPLILVPVQIKRLDQIDKRLKTFRYEISYTDEDLYPNITLIEKLKHDFHLELPELIDPESEETLSPEQYFTKIEDLISIKQGWSIRRQIHLSFFSFSKLLMYLDLDTKKKSVFLENHKILYDVLLGLESRDLCHNKLDDYEIDKNIKIANIPLVLDADSSQQSAIYDALKGENLVIEGPPGTGKSQTITNLIAACIGQGKRVLFVAEKLAALQIVKNHLDSLELGDFCLELHSNKVQKKSLLKNLKSRIDKSFRLKSDFEIEKKALQEKVSALNEYIKILHTPIAGLKLTLYELIGEYELLKKKKLFDFSSIIGLELNIDKATLDRRINLLVEYINNSNSIDEKDLNFWKGFDAHKYLPTDETKVKCCFEALRRQLDVLVKDLKELCCTLKISFDELSKQNIFELENIKEINSNLFNLSAFDRILVDYFSGRIEIQKIRDTEVLLEEIIENYNNAKLSITNKDNIDQIFLDKIDIQKIIIASQLLASVKISSLKVVHKLSKQSEHLLVSIIEADRIFTELGLTESRSLKDFENSSRVIEYLNTIPKSVDSLTTPLSLNKEKLESLEISLDHYKKFQDIKTKIEEYLRYSELDKQDSLKQILHIFESSKKHRFRILKTPYRQCKKIIKPLIKLGQKFNLIKIINALKEYQIALEINHKLSNDETLGSIYNVTIQDSNYHELLKLKNWLCGFRELFDNEYLAFAFIQSILKNSKVDNRSRQYLEEFKQNITGLINILGKNDLAYEKIKSFEEKTFSELKENLQQISVLAYEISETAIVKYVHSSITIESLNKTVQFLELLEKNLKKFNKRKFVSEYKLNIEKVLNSTLDNKINTLKNTLRILEHFETLGISSTLLNFLGLNIFRTNFPSIIKIGKQISEIKKQLNKLQSELKIYGGFSLETFFVSIKNSFINLSTILEKCYNENIEYRINSLTSWSQLCRSLDKLKKYSMEKIVETPISTSANLVDSYKCSVYRSIIHRTINDHNILLDFNRLNHEKLRDSFIECDSDLKNISHEYIAYHASRCTPPVGVSRGKAKDLTELSLLKREIEKQKKHIPIRSLIERAKSAIISLKPCFMMSPTSVAQFLPLGSIEFDLMIVDEASQIKAQEALGALLRSKQLVVVGDSNQLPPTSFFDNIEADMNTEEESLGFEDSQSILDACSSAQFRKRKLRWHYRSRHESLIAFSNSQFYEKDLIIFPANIKHESLGIKYQYIENGFFTEQRNIEEAKKIVQLIVEHARYNSIKSLGVVAFNISQKDLIDELLEKERKNDPKIDSLIRNLESVDKKESLFIKNLESVQGDERDVMILSCTYGPDKTSGRVFQRFGPINRSDGWKRLNVICTRAKEKMIVVSSLRSSDFKISPSSSKGAVSFKNFIKYAETGILPEQVVLTKNLPDSPFEESVGNFLISHGYKIAYQVGVAGFFIDIGIYDPKNNNEFILGVECDGASYHSAKSARDRDRIREEVLRSRGWDIYRIWSTDWFFNSKTEGQRLLNSIKV